MKSFRCTCGNRLFYENSQCVQCKHEVGWCPRCELIVRFHGGDDQIRCGNPECGAKLAHCSNRTEYQVCNRALLVDELSGSLCDCCRLNRVIPDLGIPGNLEKWRRLEVAKRRLIYLLKLLNLPIVDADNEKPNLQFEFKADSSNDGENWRSMGDTEKVYTGHANGVITINVAEADDVFRERVRVELGQSHRTLIGHFRHEIGHYYWDALIKNIQEDEFSAVFGDHRLVDYAASLQKYYSEGPAAHWANNYITAYSSVHPWEDFAETFAKYLDMTAVCDTAFHLQLTNTPVVKLDLPQIVDRYARLGVIINEVNRSMGLMDLEPSILGVGVIPKLTFIHALVKQASADLLTTQATGDS